jgi:hypothetical protein
MREHATQKLAHAYRLDEIASSVAMMQSASALEDVAGHVLQRDEENPDAQYVHFFHEKIPSMTVAENTNLDPLADVIRSKPTDGSAYRTRAVARIFKDDFEGVVRDCTEGLAVSRLYNPQRQNTQRDLILAKDASGLGRDRRNDGRLAEEDQPSSLESQLLFYRGNGHLTLATEQIGSALYGNAHPRPLFDEPSKVQADARRLVRTYAKRALRDYLAFLSRLEYTPGLSAEYTEAFLEKVSSNALECGSRSARLLDGRGGQSGLSEALVRYELPKDRQAYPSLPQIPKPSVHKLDDLFAAVPPANLPPYPPEHNARPSVDHPSFSLPDFSEAVTYHPLLTEVLHSVLLCHCLIQTSSKELLRHAYMAARIARVCDGYPIFLAARSPARADWIEILRRNRNWLGLSSSWESLCAPAPLPGQKSSRKETPQERQVQLKEQAFVEALGDERVVDEETFAANFRARELRAAREEEEATSKEYNRTKMLDGPGLSRNAIANENDASPPKRWGQADGKQYPIITERAEVIVRWIQEAPPPSSADGTSRPKKKTGAKGRLKKQSSNASSLRGSTETGLEQSVGSVDLVD